MKKQHANQSGVGLVEVLVAIIILSIGFLAAAKMQVAGMRFSQNAYFLSQGNFMLKDITDRMRANRQGVIDGHYTNFTTIAGTSDAACIAAGTKCSPEQIAVADLHAWSSYLYSPTGDEKFKPALPSFDTMPANGDIDYNETTNVYTVSVTWGEQFGDTLEARVLKVRLTP